MLVSMGLQVRNLWFKLNQRSTLSLSQNLGNFSVEALQNLIRSPDVEHIEEDGIVTIQSKVTQ